MPVACSAMSRLVASRRRAIAVVRDDERGEGLAPVAADPDGHAPQGVAARIVGRPCAHAGTAIGRVHRERDPVARVGVHGTFTHLNHAARAAGQVSHEQAGRRARRPPKTKCTFRR